MSKGQRIQKTRDLFGSSWMSFLLGEVNSRVSYPHLGISGRVFDVGTGQPPTQFPDDVKSMAFVQRGRSKRL
jgi:hypothetical protein